MEAAQLDEIKKMKTEAMLERIQLLESAFDATLRISMVDCGLVVESSTSADRLFMQGMHSENLLDMTDKGTRAEMEMFLLAVANKSIGAEKSRVKQATSEAKKR